MLRRLLDRLWGPSPRALAYAHEQAEAARRHALANEAPPPGVGWRCGDMDSDGKWTVWRGDTRIASFLDPDEAQAWARSQNADPVRPVAVMRDDGKYCANCGSLETADSIKARGYHSCCPERHVIPRLWEISDGPAADGKWHLWKPAEGLGTIERHGWGDAQGARMEADNRNIAEDRRERESRDPNSHQGKLAAFLDVSIPAGAVVALGPLRSPTDDLWWVFDAGGPTRGFLSRPKAGAYVKRRNRLAVRRGQAAAS